ncbi:MAG TPA: YebC/PmpR family DNA-binding transcriptional regulator [Gemmatimonadaceae bacterium]|jgi:YebC/PmpR family DNA-binding regulatory protein
MAGHSKWKQIKHYKAATDKKRGALFTKLIREITMAAKLGGGDPGGNPRLRLAIDTAKSASMPRENIERAVLKGTGELEGVDYQEVTYEGFGPAGVAMLIDTVTDNPTRTVADVRNKMTKLGGNLGAINSVAWMFEKKGQIYVDASKIDEDTLMEKALDAGADDVQREDERFIVSTGPTEFHAVQEGLKSRGVEITEAELAMLPKNTVQLDAKGASSLFKLIETIEDLDDVQKVWANFDIDAAELEKVEG